MIATLVDALMAVGLLILGWGFAQFLLHVRYGRAELAAALASPGRPTQDYTVAFLVPCLDEEHVIGETVRALRALAPGSLVVVVDDASGDATAALALEAGAVVVSRTLPEARLGKGPALNAGYARLLEVVEERQLDPDRTIVCVMDADGRLSENAVPEVLARFDRPSVGGVQLPVRIRNRDSFLGRMQDLEFWGMSAIAQMARIRTRSVSLGGNGQFTRLAALRQVGDAPWSSALTEDLDLGLELTLRGWDLECAPSAWVSQQGVETVRALVRQRTRWYQGHIVCSRKGWRLWESDHVDRRTALETTLYLATPVFVILPWSIIFTLALLTVAQLVLTEPVVPIDGVEIRIGFYLAFWYLLTFIPALMLGLLYAERSGTSRVRALALAHVQVFYAYVNLVAAWRAVARIALGRHGWTKTPRVAEEA
jgi:1,2-diacylglycerol 3-beta-glucosyltransferase